MNSELLPENQLQEELQKLDVEWSSIPGQGLVRVFETENFAEGLALLGRLAKITEAQHHDPDVHLTVNELELTLTTHSAGGVTRKDVEVARAIDKLMFQDQFPLPDTA